MQTFTKEERLCSRQFIERLFADGSSFFMYPFAIHYLELPPGTQPFPARVAFAASKKRFKKAVDRNLIKRRMREIYRLNKVNFYNHLNAGNKQVVFLVSYSAKEIMSYEQLSKKLLPALERLSVELNVKNA
ncbi:MAG: ribonuclease P protein component [Bacteroidia bacterium]